MTLMFHIASLVATIAVLIVASRWRRERQAWMEIIRGDKVQISDVAAVMRFFCEGAKIPHDLPRGPTSLARVDLRPWLKLFVSDGISLVRWSKSPQQAKDRIVVRLPSATSDGSTWQSQLAGTLGDECLVEIEFDA